jgi:hypothetical protein
MFESQEEEVAGRMRKFIEEELRYVCSQAYTGVIRWGEVHEFYCSAQSSCENA